jgi:hypothetical protein
MNAENLGHLIGVLIFTIGIFWFKSEPNLILAPTENNYRMEATYATARIEEWEVAI